MSSEPHVISVSAAIKHLTTTMQNPMRIDACARRMAAAADRIDQALEARTLVSEKIKFAKSHPEFLRAGIKFLTSSQSKEDWFSMVEHLAECQCDVHQSRMKKLHYPNRFRPDGRITVRVMILIFDVVSIVGTCIILALYNLTQGKFHTGKTTGGQDLWPQDSEDLLPYGPKATVTGLTLWLWNPPEGHIIFSLAGRLALYHVPFLREVYDKALAIGRSLLHLDIAIKFYAEGNSSPLARIHFFSEPVSIILRFFEDLALCNSSKFNDLFIRGREWLLPTLPCLKDILRTMPQEWSKMSKIVTYLIGCAHAELDEATGVISINVGCAADLPDLEATAVEQALDIIIHARSTGCWNITCPSAPEGIQLRVCRRCDLIRFCGEECQRWAWKSTMLPHKVVCSQIHSLKESFGSNWPRIWTPDFTYDQFQAICAEKMVDTEIVESIATTLCSLKHYRNAFLRNPEVLANPDAHKKLVMKATLSSGQVVQIL